EDGIRGFHVTGVQTCALPISDGHSVFEARNGEEALALIETAHPDAVLLDFAMPGMNGAELAEELGKRRPGLPMVFASGYADTDEIGRASCRGKVWGAVQAESP